MYIRRERESDVSKRRSITVAAREDYDIDARTLKWILRDQGRFEGKDGMFSTTEEYRQYEHVVQNNIYG